MTTTAALTACEAESDSPPAPQAVLTLDKSAPKVQQVDAPIYELVESGEHCFSSAVDAVAAQLRAARAIDRDNAEEQRHHDQTGELLRAGFPTQVTEVSKNCYSVVPTDADHPR
jgi:hypothetical protein